jgi:hypothetical protein
MPTTKYWEIIADKLHASGCTCGYCRAVTKDGWRWIVDAHREGRRYIVHSDELLGAFPGKGDCFHVRTRRLTGQRSVTAETQTFVPVSALWPVD